MGWSPGVYAGRLNCPGSGVNRNDWILWTFRCSLFDAGRRPSRTRPQGGTIDVPRPDAIAYAGAHSGSHPEGRNGVEDASGVDRARTLAEWVLRVGEWFQG